MATGMQDRLAVVGDTLKGLDESAVADLRASLKEKTGVDFGSYVNKEMMETLGELLQFPKYALKTVLRPPAVCAALFMFGTIACALWQGIYISGSLLVVAAAVLGVLNGFVMAPVALIRRITGDIGGLADFALQQTETLLRDIEHMVDFANNPDREWPRLTEVFQGVAFIIILPSVLPVVRKKVPLVGRPMAWLVRRVFGGVVRGVCVGLDEAVERMARKAPAAEQEEHHLGDQESVAAGETPDGERYELDLSTAIRVVESVRGGVAAIVEKAVRFGTLPLRIVSAVSLAASVGLLALLFYLRSLIG